MPAPTLTWLLDKNVARRAIEGISAALTARTLTYEQSVSIRLIILSRQAGITLAITPEAANILERRPGTAIRLFLGEVISWRRGRYWARWARRLRERVHDHHLALERRLKAMTSHLSESYRLVVLPEIIYPNQGLELLYSILISDL